MKENQQPPKMKTGILKGTIEGFEGEFECAVYVSPESRTKPPLGYMIGYAIRQVGKS